MSLNPGHDISVLEQAGSLYQYLLLFTQGYKLVPARVEVDNGLKKPLERHGSPGVYTFQGAGKDYRNVILLAQ